MKTFDVDTTYLIRNKYGEVFYSSKDTNSFYVHIFNLYIEPEYRNKGQARKLLNQAIYEIRELGWKDEIEIVCDPIEKGIDKERLKQFYKSLGLKVYEYYG